MISFGFVFLVAIALYICVEDFRFHRISHSSVLLISISLLICNGGDFFLVSGIIIASVALLMGLYAGLGGGDVKLLIVIGFIGVEISRLTDFILWFAMISLPICLIYGVKKRTLKTQIPLGPALCGALIITLI